MIGGLSDYLKTIALSLKAKIKACLMGSRASKFVWTIGVFYQENAQITIKGFRA